MLLNMWALRDHTKERTQYSAMLYTWTNGLVRKVCEDVPQVVPASFDKSANLEMAFWHNKGFVCR